MSEQRLLKPEEAAQMLGVSIHTLYGWTSSRKVPFRKVGRLLRFNGPELEAWTRQGASRGQNQLDEKP